MPSQEDIVKKQLRRRVFEDVVRAEIYNTVNSSEDYYFKNTSDSEWVNRYTRKGSRPWSYDEHTYQVQMLDDPTHRMVAKKAAQMGITDILARKAICQLCRHERTSVLFTQRSDDMASKFATTRVDTIFQDSPAINRYLAKGKADSVSLKKIKDGFMYILSGWSYDAIQSYPIDFLYVDEYDRQKPDVIGAMRTRMDHSEYRYEYDFSTPTIEGVGIDLLWQNSDKKEWFVCCTRCEEWQIITYNSIMFYPRDEEHREPYFGCCKCKANLQNSIIHGQWRPTAKGEYSGYHITQAMSPRQTCKEIYDNRFNNKYPSDDDYWNFTWGEAVKGTLSSEIDNIDYDTLYHDKMADCRCRSHGKAVMGIDWGKPWSFAEVRLINDEGVGEIIWIECFHSEDLKKHAARMIELARDSEAGMVCADIGYANDCGYELQQTLESVFWDVSSNATGVVNPVYDKTLHRVRCFKECILKHHFVLLSRRDITIPQDPLGVTVRIGREPKKPSQLWIKHHQSLSIRKDKNGEEEIIFKGENHLLLASAYCDLAFEYMLKKQGATQKHIDRRVKISFTGAHRR